MDRWLESTETERKALEQTAKYGHCRLLRRRAQAILLPGRGRTPVEAAEILNTRKVSIYQWRRNWRDSSLAGLAEGRHTGRPSRYDEELFRYQEELADSGAYGIRQLMAMMKERYPEFSMHPGSLLCILHERGFRWKRTCYSLKKTAAASLSAGP